MKSFSRYMAVCMLLFLFVYNLVTMYNRYRMPETPVPVVVEMQENREEDAEYYKGEATDGDSVNILVVGRYYYGDEKPMVFTSRDSLRIVFTCNTEE